MAGSRSTSPPPLRLPNTTYIASYYAPAGHYADSAYYFYTPPPTGGNILNSPPLHALSASGPVVNGLYTSANGVYTYGSTSSFPTSSFQGTNYWVEPVFEPTSAAGQVTNVSATASNRSATVSWRAPSTGGTGHQLHDHPVHRLRSTAGHDDHRHAAGEQRDGHRTDRRHQLHVHGHGH